MPTLDLHFVEGFSRLVNAGVAGLWQGVALSLLAAGLLPLLHRASAGLRHVFLVIVFAIAAVLPWLHLDARHANTSVGHALSMAPWLAGVIGITWIVLSCTRATALSLAWCRLRSVREHAKPILLEGMDEFSVGARRVVLCVSSDVNSPTIIGFLRPRMLLPVWMVPLLAEGDLQQITLHECEHLRRYDDWLNLLLKVALVLFPLNPALVWLDGRIDIQRELACDAAVVGVTSQPIAYATCLTRLADLRKQQNRLALAMAAWGKQSQLGQRVQVLLAQSTPWTRRQAALATTASAAVLLAGTVALARTPQLIRIAAVPQAASMMTTLEQDSSAQFRNVRFDAGMPKAVRAVPATFQLKPAGVQVPARAALRKRGTNRVADSHWSNLPHGLQASAVGTQKPTSQPGHFRAPRESNAVRFIPTNFSPYFAVPVADGWLVIHL